MSAEGVVFTKDFLTKFIDIYKEHPALWKIKSKEYTNKNLKNRAYDAVIDYCKLSYPKADRKFVCNKIQNIRGCFRKELRKVEASQRSGASADDVYEPHLWYFDLLLFTTDQEVPVMSMESEGFDDESQASNLTENEETEIDETESQPQDSQEKDQQTVFKKPASPKSQQVTFRTHNANRKRKSSFQEQQQQFMKTCTEVLQQKETTVDEFEAIGITVASKLKRMNPTQQLLAEGLINKILLKGIFNELTRTTDFADNLNTQSRQLLQTYSYHDESSNSMSTPSPLTSPPSTELTHYYANMGQDLEQEPF